MGQSGPGVESHRAGTIVNVDRGVEFGRGLIQAMLIGCGEHDQFDWSCRRRAHRSECLGEQPRVAPRRDQEADEVRVRQASVSDWFREPGEAGQVVGRVDVAQRREVRPCQVQLAESAVGGVEKVLGAPGHLAKQFRVWVPQADEGVAAIEGRSKDDVGLVESAEGVCQTVSIDAGAVGANDHHALCASVKFRLDRGFETLAEVARRLRGQRRRGLPGGGEIGRFACQPERHRTISRCGGSPGICFGERMPPELAGDSGGAMRTQVGNQPRFAGPGDRRAGEDSEMVAREGHAG